MAAVVVDHHLGGGEQGLCLGEDVLKGGIVASMKWAAAVPAGEATGRQQFDPGRIGLVGGQSNGFTGGDQGGVRTETVDGSCHGCNHRNRG
ncbi:MAG: hypothetical protein ABJQ21_24925 [Roseibium sp.]